MSTMSTPADRHLRLGGMLFPGIDQMDFTGPFEVLSKLPNSTFHVLAKENKPVRDIRGLILTPETALSEAPALDLLLVPGGFGQEDLMDDQPTLSFIRAHAASSGLVLSVCTGALLCGAAGLLRGVRATTHWSAMHLLSYFGATPVNERVVVAGRLITTAGVTAGIEGALRAAALLRGERVAQLTQLLIQYAPEPPWNCGQPSGASPELRAAADRLFGDINRRREQTARRWANEHTTTGAEPGAFS